MQIRIETDVPAATLKSFLNENNLRVPVFFDKNTHVVIILNRRNRRAALQLIEWLATR